MERRFLLAIVLSIGVVFLWSAFFAKPPPKPAAKPRPATPAPGGPTATPEAPVPAPGPQSPEPPPGPPAAARRQQAEHLEFDLTPAEGEFSRVGFTSRGGAITSLTLRDAHERAERDVPQGEERWRLDLVLPCYPDLLTGMLSFDDADAEGLRSLDWTVVSRTDRQVVFAFVTGDGLRVVKTYTLPSERERFDVDLSVAVHHVEGTAAKEEKRTLRLLGAAGFAREPENHTGMATPTQPVVWIKGQQSEPVYEPWRVKRTELDAAARETRAFRLAGVKSHYFLLALFSEGGASSPLVRATWVDGGDADRRDRNAAFDRLTGFYKDRGRTAASDPVLVARLEDAALNFHRAWVEFDVGVVGSGSPAGEQAVFHVYAGPVARGVLGQDRYAALSDLITYPFAPDFVARILLSIFDLFQGLTGSAGLAVVLMTLVVRGGLMPLSIRNQLSMRTHGRKVAKLKPKLDSLKKRFANDPKRFREEQVKLFRAHGVGFPMGCLMLLLQMPIFFALFSSLRVEYGIWQRPFAWIHDLSGPDRLVDFGLSKPLLSVPPGGIWGLNVLPLLYMALSVWQQRLMPKPMDEQQAQQMKMAKWMSIIFPILLYNYTAALALYMCVSSLVAIVEGRIVRARDAHLAAAMEAAPAGAEE